MAKYVINNILANEVFQGVMLLGANNITKTQDKKYYVDENTPVGKGSVLSIDHNYKIKYNNEVLGGVLEAFEIITLKHEIILYFKKINENSVLSDGELKLPIDDIIEIEIEEL